MRRVRGREITDEKLLIVVKDYDNRDNLEFQRTLL